MCVFLLAVEGEGIPPRRAVLGWPQGLKPHRQDSRLMVSKMSEGAGHTESDVIYSVPCYSEAFPTPSPKQLNVSQRPIALGRKLSAANQRTMETMSEFVRSKAKQKVILQTKYNHVPFISLQYPRGVAGDLQAMT